MYAVPSNLKSTNKRIVKSPAAITPVKIQGLYFPHFVCVLSTITPIIGSFKASKILAPKIMAVTHHKTFVSRLSTSVK